MERFAQEAEEFADALLQGRLARIPPEDGVADMRAIDSLYRSAAAQGRRVTV